MEATAKVSIDASGYEAGAQKITRADAAMAASARSNFDAAGKAAKSGFDTVSVGAERASRSYRELDATSQRVGRAVSGNMSELAHSGRAFVDMLAAGQTAMRALQSEAPRVVQAFGGGVGAIAGVGAISGLIGAYEKAQDSQRAFRDTLGAGGVHGSAASSKVFEQQIEAITKARDTMREGNSGFFSTMAETSKAFLTGHLDLVSKGPATPEQRERDQLEATASAQIVGLQNQKVAVLKRENDERERASALGASALKIAELELQRRREIEEAQERVGKTPGLTFGPEEEQINRRFAAQETRLRRDIAERAETLDSSMKVNDPRANLSSAQRSDITSGMMA